MSASRDDFGIAIRSALLQRGAKQKFSLFFLISLSTIIFFLDSYPSKFMDNTRSILNDGIYRTANIATSPFKFVRYLNNKVITHFSIYKKNEILQKELEILRSKKFQNEFLLAENRKLQEILESEEAEKYSYQIAKVLLDKESYFLKSIIINKGSRSNIQKGMPVLDGINLVGRVVEVNYLSSRVLLLNDLNSRIPVIIEPLGIQSILVGEGKNKPNLEYLPESYVTESGNTVFTSGKDGIFSPGIPVGKIIKEEQKVKVKLFSDSNQLSFVNIILKKNKPTRGIGF